VFFGKQGWEVSTLGMNAGHLQGTGWIDAPGNIVLAGHVELADGRAGIFAHIGQMKLNDPVFLIQDHTTRRYRVTEVRTVAPDDMSVVYPTTTDRLTLITCTDYDFTLNTYRARVVVIAERVR
jgi:LPXTG-site transpeptidase (sortase) family protein